MMDALLLVVLAAPGCKCLATRRAIGSITRGVLVQGRSETVLVESSSGPGMAVGWLTRDIFMHNKQATRVSARKHVR